SDPNDVGHQVPLRNATGKHTSGGYRTTSSYRLIGEPATPGTDEAHPAASGYPLGAQVATRNRSVRGRGSLSQCLLKRPTQDNHGLSEVWAVNRRGVQPDRFDAGKTAQLWLSSHGPSGQLDAERTRQFLQCDSACTACAGVDACASRKS